MAVAAYMYVVTILILLSEAAYASMKCNNCTYTEKPGNVGYDCVTNPQNSNVESCTNGTTRCHTTTQYSRATGRIYSLVRACDYKNKTARCTEDLRYRTCISVCEDSDQCNHEDKTVKPFDVVPTEKPDVPHVTDDKGTSNYTCYLCVFNYNVQEIGIECVEKPHLISGGTVRCGPGKTCYVSAVRNTAQNRWRTFARGCDDMRDRPKTCERRVNAEDCTSVCCHSYCNTDLGSSGVDDSCAAGNRGGSGGTGGSGGSDGGNGGGDDETSTLSPSASTSVKHVWPIAIGSIIGIFTTSLFCLCCVKRVRAA